MLHLGLRKIAVGGTNRHIIDQRALGVLEMVILGVGFGFLGALGKKVLQTGLSPGEIFGLRLAIFAALVSGSRLG